MCSFCIIATIANIILFYSLADIIIVIVATTVVIIHVFNIIDIIILKSVTKIMS